MSANTPEMLDAWRMVAARRSFEGRLPLSSMKRLQGLLVDTEGEARFAIEFDRDSLQVPYVELRIDAALPLVCQRSLERFLLPVSIVQRLGLVNDEADEAALPPDYEALLVPEDGMLHTADIVEDELVLAVPALPLSPDSDAVDRDWPAQEEELAKANPFAALASLKKN
ncbi:YceD family protein [Pseudoxanthomonas dokdonensis]|uniref:Large ribosomal RNA subunit accumulation protein YceD n=1 Tax=Pseudoxanthomonas dokdonensis TaxID=344882 RepID=A0A0R0CZR4_9GAMM|nr:YceD family protein [Pseudoxanthomonas dokdonensis]KRG70851.1 characterized ACR protein [Pseudoxanthomonas dokdonensis]